MSLSALFGLWLTGVISIGLRYFELQYARIRVACVLDLE